MYDGLAWFFCYNGAFDYDGVPVSRHATQEKGHGRHADANFSILRRTALSLLKNNHSLKVGVKNKRLAAGWDDSYLEQILFGQ